VRCVYPLLSAARKIPSVLDHLLLQDNHPRAHLAQPSLYTVACVLSREIVTLTLKTSSHSLMLESDTRVITRMKMGRASFCLHGFIDYLPLAQSIGFTIQ
jgi:hypothetical protein